MNTEQKRRLYQKRRKFLYTALGSSCVWCGSKEDIVFDHIQRTQKGFHVRCMASVSLKRFEEEIPKLQPLCQKCHAQKCNRERHHPNDPIEMDFSFLLKREVPVFLIEKLERDHLCSAQEEEDVF